jgi:hypothetical protein
MKCEKCGHEFNYENPTETKSFYVIERRSEMYRGNSGSVAFCKGCAPFGNTKIPEQI